MDMTTCLRGNQRSIIIGPRERQTKRTLTIILYQQNWHRLNRSMCCRLISVTEQKSRKKYSSISQLTGASIQVSSVSSALLEPLAVMQAAATLITRPTNRLLAIL